MAIYNEILAGRYARMLQKLFSMKGPVPAKQLAGEIMPVFPFFSGAEHRYLEGWHRFGTAVQMLAVAAAVNILQFNNPPSSNAIFVFEKLTYSSATGADGVIVTSAPNNPAALTTAISFAGTRWDSRGNPNPVLSGSQQQTASVDLGTTRVALNVAVNTPLEVIFTDIQEFVLLPGEALRIRNVTVNVNSNFTFFWRERALEESEAK